MQLLLRAQGGMYRERNLHEYGREQSLTVRDILRNAAINVHIKNDAYHLFHQTL